MEEDYLTWKNLELLQLLIIMNEEECPMGHSYKQFEEIAEIAAEKLDIEPKEVKWLVKKKEIDKIEGKKSERKRMKKKVWKPTRNTTSCWSSSQR